MSFTPATNLSAASSEALTVAYVSTLPPRQCGLATFCTALEDAVSRAARSYSVPVPVLESNLAPDGPSIVRDDVDSYIKAAQQLNQLPVDIVCIQHEFGIFGGASGSLLGRFLSTLDKPVISILHTILPDPSEDQRRAMDAVIAGSAKLVTMSQKGRRFLKEVYGVPEEKIVLIEHGFYRRTATDPEAQKKQVGLGGKKVLLTFGLVSAGKGIETAISALPDIVKLHPDLVYVIAGATHPAVLRDEGERYRDSLVQLAEELGVVEHLHFVNRFMEDGELLDWLSLADVYVTPYPNLRQITSGTLSFAFGNGVPVVSTPYWHAEELLADGRGCLVPPHDPEAMASAITGLLSDDEKRLAMADRARAYADAFTWEATGHRYAELMQKVSSDWRSRRKLHFVDFSRNAPAASIELPFAHLSRLNDGVGIAQHAVHKIPDRRHGYCTDDCARMLMVVAPATGRSETPPAAARSAYTCAAFLEHAWNEEEVRFRNFMSYDRNWLDQGGSDDSNGRALWALGLTSARAGDEGLRAWAENAYLRARPLRENLQSPRSLAFAVLAEHERRRVYGPDGDDPFLRLGKHLMHQRGEIAARQPDWVWFETALSYDNARLPQGLLLAAEVMKREDWMEEGLKTLRWLCELQWKGDFFNFIGTRNFGQDYTAFHKIDEQPIEAAALVDAAVAAYRFSRDESWADIAEQAYAWFLGQNRLRLPLADMSDGSCLDGLHAERGNQNCGAESTLALHQASLSIRDLRRLTLNEQSDHLEQVAGGQTI
ncbi:glycosyltransferase family 4 protein [Parvularcula maris]|uniref:Glycosyltransferase family 4 protein n=1 Tax=Parvularcula maris TaxID=2965077 RepID=A0A9X2L7T9_9PROT|nr:glycosyltransferase family 4 protein [Parvularcula maris]MCQ8184670.1 glycosyltransferase family 4 protein [Parvularcula maris]